MRPLSPKLIMIFLGEPVGAKALLVASPVVFWGLGGLGLLGKRKPRAALLIPVLTSVVFVCKAGGDWMHGWRFMIPACPFLAVSQVLGIRFLASRMRRSATSPQRSPALAVTAVAVALWTAAFAIAPKESWASTGFTVDPVALLRVSGATIPGFGRRQADTALFMAKYVPKSATVAWSEMGLAGFLNCDKRIIDMSGLASHEIATVDGPVYRSASGVWDPRWFEPDSPLGRILARERPLVIFTFQMAPKPPLGGYRLLRDLDGAYAYLRNDAVLGADTPAQAEGTTDR